MLRRQANFGRFKTSRYSWRIGAVTIHWHSRSVATCRTTFSANRSRQAADSSTFVSARFSSAGAIVVDFPLYIVVRNRAHLRRLAQACCNALPSLGKLGSAFAFGTDRNLDLCAGREGYADDADVALRFDRCGSFVGLHTGNCSMIG